MGGRLRGRLRSGGGPAVSERGRRITGTSRLCRSFPPSRCGPGPGILRAVSEHPNAALVRRVWDAIARGDADALRTFLAPDLVWRATARGTPWTGEHRGADAAVDMLARVGEATDVFDAKLIDILASDARVLLIFRVRIVIGTRDVELDYLLLAEVEEGRLAQIWSAALDPAAIEAFWGGLELARTQPR